MQHQRHKSRKIKVLIFVRQYLHFATAPCPPLPQERLGTTISLCEGFAVIVRDDGSVWFWGKIGTEIIDHEQKVYTLAAPICIMEGNKE